MSLSTWDIYEGNPFLDALIDLVNSYDDEDQKVSLITIRAAREVLTGRLPRHWVKPRHASDDEHAEEIP